MRSSLLWVLTIGMTFFLSTQAEASQGPGHTFPLMDGSLD